MIQNIKKYYTFRFVKSLEFFGPVVVLFWLSRGLSMYQVMWLQSIYGISVVFLEVPTGAIADRFGKKVSLILGTFLAAFGFFFYGISYHFWQFIIGEIIVAAGMAFVSGADNAFIHASLKSINLERKYNQVEGKARGLAELARSIASVLGGFIGAINLQFTLIATSVSGLLAGLIGISFKKPKIEMERKEQTNYFVIIKDSLKLINKNPELLWFISYFACFNSFAFVSYFLTQPYLRLINVSVVYIGMIFAILNLSSVLASMLIKRFNQITKKRPFQIMTVVVFLVLIIMGFSPSIYSFSLWSLVIMGLVVNEILVSKKILSIVPEGNSATVLSMQNLLRRLLYSIFGPILGLVADKFGVLKAFQFNAVVFLGVMLVVFGIRSKLATR